MNYPMEFVQIYPRPFREVRTEIKDEEHLTKILTYARLFEPRGKWLILRKSDGLIMAQPKNLEVKRAVAGVLSIRN